MLQNFVYFTLDNALLCSVAQHLESEMKCLFKEQLNIFLFCLYPCLNVSTLGSGYGMSFASSDIVQSSLLFHIKQQQCLPPPLTCNSNLFVHISLSNLNCDSPVMIV